MKGHPLDWGAPLASCICITHVRYRSVSTLRRSWGPCTAGTGRRHHGASLVAGSGASSFSSSIFGQGKGQAAGEGMDEMLSGVSWHLAWRCPFPAGTGHLPGSSASHHSGLEAPWA